MPFFADGDGTGRTAVRPYKRLWMIDFRKRALCCLGFTKHPTRRRRDAQLCALQGPLGTDIFSSF